MSTNREPPRQIKLSKYTKHKINLEEKFFIIDFYLADENTDQPSSPTAKETPSAPP